MLARMEMGMDTTWANMLKITVEVELDNPHLLTTRELATLMIRNLQMMVEEARAANEQSLASEQDLRGHLGGAARRDEPDRDV